MNKHFLIFKEKNFFHNQVQVKFDFKYKFEEEHNDVYSDKSQKLISDYKRFVNRIHFFFKNEIKRS
jgi:hypothetical protein